MTAEQYWNEDPWLARYYRDAKNLIIQRKSEEMWLQGLYNFNAVSTALSNLNFGKKRKKPNEYIKEPIRLTPLTEEEKELKVEQERQKLIAYFNNLEKQWKKKNAN